jgi:(2Fe-2S) ferredoxin
MVQACIESIDACNEGNFDKLISLPEGVGYKGLTVAPANAIVEQHHLDAWIEYEDL